MALITNEVLAAKVKTQIALDGLKAKGDIKIACKDGVITLTGTVDSEKTVEAARRSTLKVLEVMGVNNLLKTQ